jgi:FkbM family methyltransferase
VSLDVAWVRGHHFLANGLDANSVVVDLGAHRGQFSLELARRLGCRCVAVEPVAALIAEAGGDPRIRIVNAAMAPQDGPVVLRLQQNPEANTLLPEGAAAGIGELRVPGTTWPSLRQGAGLQRVALLKVDIEGAEVELLQTMTAPELAAIDQITVEFHPDLTGPTAVRETIARVEAQGFWSVPFSRGYGDVLLLNQATFHLNAPQRLWLRHAVRNWLGLKRIARRWLGRAA